MSVSNTSKSATATMANATKHAATFTRYVKAGFGWNYDEPTLTYDGATDPISGSAVLYDSIGTLPVWANATKHIA